MTESPYGAWCGEHWEERWDRLKAGDHTMGAWMKPGGSYPTNTQPCDVAECPKPAYMIFEAAVSPESDLIEDGSIGPDSRDESTPDVQ